MSVLDAVERLRAELESLANALAEPAEAELVAIEPRLATALNALAKTTRVAPEERARLAAELIRVSAAIKRCRSLGTGLVNAARTVLAAQGRDGGYCRHGHSPSADNVRGTAVSASL
jgi:hypothetical protein